MKKTGIIILAITLSLATTYGSSEKVLKTEFNTSNIPEQSLNLDSVAAAPTQRYGDTSIKTAFDGYHGSATMLTQLIHTKLEVKFDWQKQYLYGKATITLQPYYYSTDTLVLDAKGYDVKEVSLVKGTAKTPLKYTYDKKQLHITLDKTYTRKQQYTVFIDYTAKPDEQKDEIEGSQAITSHKGLFFINPKDSEKNKPRELWTQGETEDNSCWFPTIDKPNQRMTVEIYMTVEKGFKTLSNGALVASVMNSDGTRTDHWSLSAPTPGDTKFGIPPYLVMMAAGPFTIIHDTWKGKNVDYYVDPKYAPYAKDIFGRTPQMIECFSKLLHFPYAWNKYDQVVAHDYVSGAMENTTATLHGEFVEKNRRELIDNMLENQEDVISHELFHHWFGDLVTCESWSNIALNESFATYGEYLWRDYRYGRDEADELLQEDGTSYIGGADRSQQHDLISFTYNDKEDLFDLISYQKGGCILHMLRDVVGDSAFFDALHLYLETNKFTPVEGHELRLAFEKVTGRDLNWFFNEWFYNKGFPVLDIKHSYDADKQEETVEVDQNQDLATNALIKMPVNIDIYYNGTKESHQVTIRKTVDKFTFHVPVKPDWVDFDSHKMLLCTKNEDVNTKEREFEYAHATKYLARYEAIRSIGNHKDKPGAKATLMNAMNDKYWYLRKYAIDKMGDDTTPEFKAQLEKMAVSDSSAQVRITAINTLANYFHGDDLLAFYRKDLNDSSYGIESAALSAIAKINKAEALNDAKQFEKTDEKDLLLGVANIYATYGDDANNDFFAGLADKVSGFEQIPYVAIYGRFLKRCKDETVTKALPILANVVKNGDNKYSKMYAKNSLQQLLSACQDHEADLKSQIADQGKQATPDNAKIATLQSQLSSTQSLEKKISDAIGQ